MRIWDLSPEILCRKHLLGEHRELHAIWTIITKGKRGYTNHPETKRWVGRLRALYLRHEALVAEMKRRGYHHSSPLEEELACGSETQDIFVDAPDKQVEILKQKGCDCKVSL
ncbi:MAG: pyrimidine dimer DNA glycosylase/endonuclease V [bacterium]